MLTKFVLLMLMLLILMLMLMLMLMLLMLILMLREIVAKLERVASAASFFCLNQKVSPILPLYQPTIYYPNIQVQVCRYINQPATVDSPNTQSCHYINPANQ